MIAVIDYKAGNLTSVMKALAALGAVAQVTEDPAVVGAAERDPLTERRRAWRLPACAGLSGHFGPPKILKMRAANPLRQIYQR